MQIKCPHCSNKIDITDNIIITEMNDQLKSQLEQQAQLKIEEEKVKLRDEMMEFKKRKEEEAKANQELEAKRLQDEKLLMEQKLEQSYGAKLKFLQEQAEQQQKALKSAQEKEVQILQLQQELENRSKEAELSLQKALLLKEQEIKDSVGKKATADAEEMFQLKIKELESKLEQQRKLTEESQKKLNQGSMEAQGEVQEEFLKEKLSKLFPYDEIVDVKKGQKGGDLIHIVKNQLGQPCGTILYESKNTSAWSNAWISKLLEDRRSLNAELGVIITKTFPANVKSIGHQDGIWICGIKEFEGVAAMLRDGIIKVHEAKKSEDNKADKMVMLYDYLNSTEFKQRWEALLDGFKRMKKAIDDQRNHAIKSYAEQDAIINNILLHGNTFIGSIKGIAGSGFDQVKLLE